MNRFFPGSKVYLVGAGPGDPDLITLRGAKVLGRADVVAYDRLVHPELLRLAPGWAERIPVGKQREGEAGRQDAINRLLARRALAGKCVVRLKGGDPLLFGRGAEEALYLTERGIAVEIVPGLSSALAGPAAVGIPVTHRGIASSLAVVTGHSSAEGSPPADWDLLARSVDTLVVLMGRSNLPAIADRLLQSGKSPATPAAVIESATWPGQRQIWGRLDGIAQAADQAAIQSPALLVVGPTVEIGRQLWASISNQSATVDWMPAAAAFTERAATQARPRELPR